MNRAEHWRVFLSFVDHPERVDVEALIKQLEGIDPNSMQKGQLIKGADRALTLAEHDLVWRSVDAVPPKPCMKRA